MARVTVEDCVEKIPNRFDLVMVAAQRSRDISAGAALTLDRDNDKNPVVALREVADETIEIEEVREALVRSLQRHVEIDEPEDDHVEARLAEGGALTAGAIFGDPGAQPQPDYDDDAVVERLGMRIQQGAEADAGGFEDIDESVLAGEA